MKYYTTDPGAQGPLHPCPARTRRLPRPAPGHPRPENRRDRNLLHASSADYGGRAQVDHIARLLGADISDETAHGGHYWAVRNFGPIGYEIVAISEHCTAVHDALMSYRGYVTPPPPTPGPDA